VQALYEKMVAEVNNHLAPFETIKRVILVPEEFTVENGALTASMKMRRRAIEQRYCAQIDAVYAAAEARNSEAVGVS
jgi:long-chain acyl-CoA synthetase